MAITDKLMARVIQAKQDIIQTAHLRDLHFIKPPPVDHILKQK